MPVESLQYKVQSLEKDGLGGNSGWPRQFRSSHRQVHKNRKGSFTMDKGNGRMISMKNLCLVFGNEENFPSYNPSYLDLN